MSPGYLFSDKQRRKQETCTCNTFKGARVDCCDKKIAEKISYFGQTSHVYLENVVAEKTLHEIAENINVFICTRTKTIILARETLTI